MAKKDPEVKGISDRINESLLEERDQAVAELKKVTALLGRPVNVTIQSSEEATLKKVGEYLPQLTYLSTNAAQIASAIQASTTSISGSLYTLNQNLERIAKALEEK